MYFNNDGEPDEFVFEFLADIKRIMAEQGKDMLMVEFADEETYYEVMNYAQDFVANHIEVYGVVHDGPKVIFAKEPDMVAEHEAGIAQDLGSFGEESE